MNTVRRWLRTRPRSVRRWLRRGRRRSAEALNYNVLGRALAPSTAHYFAYGSNMKPSALLPNCPSRRYLGPARIEDCRLAFTRRSIRTNTGVADILRSDAEKMAVWGALYELDARELSALDEKEGSGRGAYKREDVTVITRDGKEHQAVTYSVLDPEEQEVPPAKEYLEGLLEGALECELPELYITFLRSLEAALEEYEKQLARYEGAGEAGDGASAPRFRSGLMVYGTDHRKEARGVGLVKVRSEIAKELDLKEYAAVLYQGRAAIARVSQLDDVRLGCCQLDQSIRHALGMPGRESYGGRVRLASLTGRLKTGFLVVRPRSLSLPAWAPFWMESEKQNVVLHPNTIRLLGLTEGESAHIFAAVKKDAGKDGEAEAAPGYELKRIKRRVFSGSEREFERLGETIDYPRIDEAYLDHDARQHLGVREKDPILIQANIFQIFVTRLVFYGVTLFLGFTALTGLGVSGPLTVLLAVLFTVALVVIDISGRLHY